MKDNLPEKISTNELKNVQESFNVVEQRTRRKRTTYIEKSKQEIVKYAAMAGVTAILR